MFQRGQQGEENTSEMSNKCCDYMYYVLCDPKCSFWRNIFLAGTVNFFIFLFDDLGESELGRLAHPAHLLFTPLIENIS